MVPWRCHLCQETGHAPVMSAAAKAFNAHYRREHYAAPEPPEEPRS